MLDNIFVSILSGAPPTKSLAERPPTAHFGVILDSGDAISVPDIREVTKNTALSPIFFAISHNHRYEVSRRYAREFNSSVIVAKTPSEALSGMRRVEFSLTEDIDGALFSLLSLTPAYVNLASDECRSLIDKLAEVQIPDGIIIPYVKGKMETVKKVRANNSDFDFTFKRVYDELRSITPPL